MDYAVGRIDPGFGLAVATHLALNPLARAEVRRLEVLGGAMLEGAPVAAVADDALSGVLARLGAVEQRPAAAVARPRPAERDELIPEPLARVLPRSVEKLAWRRVISGVEEYRIDMPAGEGKVSLLKIAPGRALPRHTHRGDELTLVLRGSYADAVGEFARGDMALLDDRVDHQPIAGSEDDCLCLVVTEAPLRLTGPFGRLLNPFIKF